MGAAPVRVDVVKPRAGGLMRQTKQPGSVHAFESVDMYAEVSGFLKTQEVDIGDVVKKGDVLAVIDVPELEKDVEEAVAAVEQAKARTLLAEARVTTADAEREAVAATLVQTEADIAQQVAKRSLSEKQLERVKGLLARNATTQDVVDEHEQDLQSTRAGERSAQAAALTAKAQLAASAAKVLQAKADVAEARSMIRLSEARLARTRVITAFSRIVCTVRRRRHRPLLPSWCLHPLGRRWLLDRPLDRDADRPDAGRRSGPRQRCRTARRRRSGHRSGRRAQGPLIRRNRLAAGPCREPHDPHDAR